MKKLFISVLSLVMAFSVSVSAFAATDETITFDTEITISDDLTLYLPSYYLDGTYNVLIYEYNGDSKQYYAYASNSPTVPYTQTNSNGYTQLCLGATSDSWDIAYFAISTSSYGKDVSFYDLDTYIFDTISLSTDVPILWSNFDIYDVAGNIVHESDFVIETNIDKAFTIISSSMPDVFTLISTVLQEIISNPVLLLTFAVGFIGFGIAVYLLLKKAV